MQVNVALRSHLNHCCWPDPETEDPNADNGYISDERMIALAKAAGFELAMVERVAGLVDRNEYKRRQAPPGVRITGRAFGRDRRYPLTSGYQNFQKGGFF